jgi:hypothetical protein
VVAESESRKPEELGRVVAAASARKKKGMGAV